MSGVIDDNGQQWEHCNDCGDFVEIELLAYEAPTEEYLYGRDLCPKCWTATSSMPTELVQINTKTGTATLVKIDRKVH